MERDEEELEKGDEGTSVWVLRCYMLEGYRGGAAATKDERECWEPHGGWKKRNDASRIRTCALEEEQIIM